MKVKRFNNLWAMGLILFGAMIIAFYIIKIVCPEFIVGVAETPEIVAFGNYVDTHKWAYYLFDSIVTFIGLYIYCGACCRTYKISCKGLVAIIVFMIALKIVYNFLPANYVSCNYVFLAFLPFVICWLDKTITKETFISTSTCFFVDIISQVMSLTIRDVVILSNQLNSATFIILLIDTWLWRFLLYCFFNYKNKKGELV